MKMPNCTPRAAAAAATARSTHTTEMQQCHRSSRQRRRTHLRQRRDGANLHKAKAQRQQRLNHFGVLVETGRDTCRIRKKRMHVTCAGQVQGQQRLDYFWLLPNPAATPCKGVAVVHGCVAW